MGRITVTLLVSCLASLSLADQACPPDTKQVGYPPPKGSEVSCINDNGKKHGPYKRWYGNGQINQHMTYQNDIEHGQQKAWWPNGQLMMEGISVNGLRFEGFNYWDMHGNKVNLTFKNQETAKSTP